MDDLIDFFGSKEFQTWWWMVIPAAILFYIIWDWVKGRSEKQLSTGKETDYNTDVVDAGWRGVGKIREKDRWWNRDHADDGGSDGGSHGGGGADSD